MLKKNPPFVLTFAQSKKLAKTVKLQSNQTRYPVFAFDKELTPDESFKSIEFEKIGLVQIPLSIQVRIHFGYNIQTLFFYI